MGKERRQDDRPDRRKPPEDHVGQAIQEAEAKAARQRILDEADRQRRDAPEAVWSPQVRAHG